MGTTCLAIASVKGGVAKTTTTVSLGGALVERGFRVLLIDLDPQANLTLALGLRPTDQITSAADLMFNGSVPQETIHPTEVEGLDLIPANNSLQMVERALPIRPHFAETLRLALQKAALDYQWVLLDCPPALGAITTNALVAAQMVVLPTQPEFFSAYALRNMLSLITQVRSKYNPHLAYKVLVTMLDRRNRIHRTVFAQMRRTFHQGMFHTVVEVDTRLRESAVAGRPVTHFNPSTRSARQYRALAEELLSYVQKNTE